VGLALLELDGDIQEVKKESSTSMVK